MKKTLKFITFIFIVITLNSCTFISIKSEDKENKEFKVEDIKKSYKLEGDVDIENLGFNKTYEMIEKEKGILVISSPNCNFCMEAMPIINKLKNEYKHIKVFYLNATYINQENRKKFDSKLSNKLKRDLNGNILFKVPDVYAFDENKILGNQRGIIEDINKFNSEYKKLFDMVDKQ